MKISFLKFEKPLTLLFFFLFLIMGVGARFLISLLGPDSTYLAHTCVVNNLGVIGLMSKHALETGEFPFFFWGQNWFGGLEAMLHGIAFWIFGVTPWAMRITPLFLFALFCILTFLIARDLFNDGVALTALLWCVFAPTYFTQLSVVPHTHYLETPVLGSLIVWLAIRLTLTTSIKVRRFLYFVLGFFGGLGWWVSPMMIYYLLGIAGFMLFRLRWEAIRLGILLSLPAFFMGAAPYFIYYAMDPYSSVLGMGGKFSLVYFPVGLKNLLLATGPELLDVPKYTHFGFWAFIAIALFYTYIFLSFLSFNIKDFSKLFYKKVLSFTHARGILVFLLLGIIVVSCSSYDAIRRFRPRYVIALYSLVPIAFGYAVWQVRKNWRWLTISLVLLYCAGQSFFVWDWISKEIPGYQAEALEKLRLIDFLKDHNIRRAYMDYRFDASSGNADITFMAKEDVICATPAQERYRPYELLLDESSYPAFIKNKPGIFSDVFEVIGGQCQTHQENRFYVYYDFQEPQAHYHQISPDEIKATSSHESNQIKKVLDRNMESNWSSVITRQAGMWIQFDLGKTYSLGMLRLWNRGELHPYFSTHLSVEVSLDGHQWTQVLQPKPCDFYYWSGPRLYYWEWSYRQELRFGPVEARFIRVIQHDHSSRLDWRISEVYFYEWLEGKNMGSSGEKEIFAAVKALKLEKIYADRWMSSQIKKISNGNIQTVEPFSFTDKKDIVRLPSRLVIWSPKTGFILEDADADEFEKTMATQGIFLTRENFSRWVLFYFPKWAENEEKLKSGSGWYWMGLGAVGINNKVYSEQLRMEAIKYEEEGHFEKALEFYGKALKSYPNHSKAREGKILLLKKMGRENEAQQEEHMFLKQTKPDHPAFVEFENGVEFLGYTLQPAFASTTGVKAGQKMTVNYYWKLKENPGNNMAVFVHIKGQGKLFQGDHNFLNRRLYVWPCAEGEVFRQKEFIQIPSGMPAGEYQIRLGLFNLENGKRRKIKNTSLKVEDKGAFIGSIKIKK